MTKLRYVLVCKSNPRHRRMVERDPWTWVPSQEIDSLMPRDALAERPDGKRLKNCRCGECGAAVTVQEIQEGQDEVV